MVRESRTELKIVTKIGGAALESEQLLRSCTMAVKQMVSDGHQVTVIHGGGVALTRTLASFGKKSEFIDGLRVTDAETRDMAVMVLAGAVNKLLVAALASVGQPSVGMCGGDGLSFRARKKKPNGHDLGYVGEISAVDPQWMQAICNSGFVPVISSLALGNDGQYYNVNADEMAAACAIACRADLLVFLTDVPGVKGADGDVIRWLGVEQISVLANHSVINGGMLPKLEACRRAVSRGVGRVRILPASAASALPDLYVRKIDFGTEVVA
jgi:acetylglutamate kinase